MIGNLADLRTTRMRAFFTRAYREYGPVFRIRVLGVPIVVLAGLEANRYAGGPGRQRFGSHQAWGMLDRHFGVTRSLISADGPEHVALRRIEGRAYTRAHFLATLDRAVAVAEEELDAVRPGPLAVAPWCKRVVTEQVARLAIDGTARPYLDDLVLYVQTMLMAHVTQKRPSLVMRRPAIRRAQHRSWQMVDELVSRRRSTGPNEIPDLIDDVLAAVDADPSAWEPADVRIAVMGAFIAGMDTAANSLAFAIHELARHPELVPGLAAEVDAAFADGVTADALGRLPGLMAFIFEVLRLHPIAPALSRHLRSDVDLGGCSVPADTHVIVATTVTHGLAEYFAEPDRFDPSRFLDERAEHKLPGAYVPFGVGPHTCAGRGMAEGLLVLDAALLLHRLSFTADPAAAMHEIARPTPSPDNRFHITVLGRRPIARSSADSGAGGTLHGPRDHESPDLPAKLDAEDLGMIPKVTKSEKQLLAEGP